MSPARQLLTEFVLARSIGEPVEVRVRLYRALAADFPETADEFKILTTFADELEAIDEKHEQLLLNLRRAKDDGRTDGDSDGGAKS